jgi:hypothetical protein
MDASTALKVSLGLLASAVVVLALAMVFTPLLEELLDPREGRKGDGDGEERGSGGAFRG